MTEDRMNVVDLRKLWNAWHQFDADAQRTGLCALGSFKDGCSHRFTWMSVVRLTTAVPEPAA